MFFTYYLYCILGIVMLPGIIMGIWAQSKVYSAFNEYNKIETKHGKTAKEVIHTVKDLGGEPLCVVVLIDKAGLSEIEGIPVESLIKVSRL